MDAIRFDSLTRQLGSSKNRRTALRLAGAGLATILIPGLEAAAETEAAQLAAANCVAIGKRCGRKNQPRCSHCCSGYTFKKRRQKRCTCRPAFEECSRPDQCCSGFCINAPCAGLKRKRCIPDIFGDPCDFEEPATGQT